MRDQTLSKKSESVGGVHAGKGNIRDDVGYWNGPP